MKIDTPRAELIADAVKLKNVREKNGVLFTWTGDHTGRSPNAKKYELDEFTEDTIDWSVNDSISPDDFDKYWDMFLAFYNKNSEKLY